MTIETQKPVAGQTEEGGGGGREIIPESDSQADGAGGYPAPNNENDSDNNPDT